MKNKNPKLKWWHKGAIVGLGIGLATSYFVVVVAASSAYFAGAGIFSLLLELPVLPIFLLVNFLLGGLSLYFGNTIVLILVHLISWALGGITYAYIFHTIRRLMKHSQKNKRQPEFTLPLVILIVVVLIAAGRVGYYFYKTLQEAEETEVPKEKIPAEKILPAEAFIRDKVELDINQDGENETLVLYVLNKKIEKDESVWCGNISGEKLKGDFYLALIDENQLQSQAKLFPYWFENGGDYKNKKLIVPQDLNGDDRKLEFTFDSYGSCNGNNREIISYSLKEQKLKRFRFYKEGKVYEKIFVSDIPGPGLEYKERFLIQKFYSNTPPIGDHYIYYVWNLQEERFDFVKEEIKPPEVKVPEESYIKVLSPNEGESINQESCKIQWDSNSVELIDILLLVYDENQNQLLCYHDPIGSGFTPISEAPIAIFKKAARAQDGYYLASFKQELEKNCSFVKSPSYYKIKLRDGFTNKIIDTSDGYFTISPAPNFKIISVNNEVKLRGRINPLNWENRTFIIVSDTILTDNSTSFYLDGKETTFEKLKQVYDEMGEYKYCPFGSCLFNSLNGSVEEISSQGQITIMAKEIFFSSGQ